MMTQILSAFFILSLAFVTGCGKICPPLPRVAGPEASDLVSKTQGFIIWRSYRQIHVLSLPKFHETTLIPKSCKKFGGLEYLSSPDEDGQIVYATNDISHRKYCVGLTTLRGDRDEIIFSRSEPKSELPALMDALALAPKGGHFAFVRADGEFPNETYTLEIWNVASKQKVDEFSVSFGSGFSWFSDGKRIVYDKRIDHTELPDFASLPTKWGNAYRADRQWPRVPATFIYDLGTHSHTFFHTGHWPIVSPDDRHVLLSDAWYDHHLFDVITGKSQPLNLPVIRSPIAFVAPALLLCEGLPTTGITPKFYRASSPFVCSQELYPIKLVDLTTGQSQTVPEKRDSPYISIQYGRAKPTLSHLK